MDLPLKEIGSIHVVDVFPPDHFVEVEKGFGVILSIVESLPQP
jgi:hypothetical protein